MSTEKQGELGRPSEDAPVILKSPAQLRWDEQRGEELCYVAEHLRRLKHNPRYTYELVYRVDLAGKDDAMLLVKAISEGAPEVAFVYAPGLLSGMSNLAGLLRSGKLKWRQDDYPSRKVLALLEVQSKGD